MNSHESNIQVEVYNLLKNFLSEFEGSANIDGLLIPENNLQTAVNSSSCLKPDITFHNLRLVVEIESNRRRAFNVKDSGKSQVRN